MFEVEVAFVFGVGEGSFVGVGALVYFEVVFDVEGFVVFGVYEGGRAVCFSVRFLVSY